MRRSRALGMPVIALCALVLGSLPALGQGEPRVVRAVGAFPADHSSTQAMQRAARELQNTTSGRLTVEVQPGLTGGAEAAIERLRTGDAVLAYVELAALEPLVPAFGVVTLPFLFQSREEAFGLLKLPSVGPLLDVELRRHGLRVLAYFDGGARHLVSSAGPLQTLLGKTIATERGPAHAQAFQAAGAKPLTGGDAQAADIREISLSQLLAGGGDVQGLQVSAAPHAFDVIAVLAHTGRYEALVIDFEELIEAAIAAAENWQRGVSAQEHAAALENLRQRGAQVAPLPDDLRTGARAAVLQMVEADPKRAQDPVLSAVVAYAQR